jgi:hypothetical protein
MSQSENRREEYGSVDDPRRSKLGYAGRIHDAVREELSHVGQVASSRQDAWKIYQRETCHQETKEGNGHGHQLTVQIIAVGDNRPDN